MKEQKVGWCAEFYVNGQSTAGASPHVCKHQLPRSTKSLKSCWSACWPTTRSLIDENGSLKQLAKLLVEKTLDAELTEHLGHGRHEAVANARGNTRNGKSRKTLKGEFGELPIEVPLDHKGTFEPH